MANKASIENIAVHEDENLVSLTLNRKLYNLEVIYGTSYIFIDRCYVFLDLDDDGNVVAHLKGREDLDGNQLQGLVGEFSNELVNQLLRVKVAKRNAKIRETIVSRALFSNFKEREIFETDIATEPTDKEYLEDPLGIATPWEERFNKDLSEGAKAKDSKGEDKK